MSDDELQNLLRTYRQRLTSRISVRLEKQYDNFRQEFYARTMGLLVTRGHMTSPDGYSVMPDGTKLFHRNADSAILVIEQKPQVRTISFTQAIVDSNDGGPSFGGRDSFRLAFPYIVFLMSFKADEDDRLYLNNVMVAYATKPLQSLESKLFHPNLPNVADFQLCWGSDTGEALEGSIASQAEIMMGGFWQTAFSTDWTDKFDDSAKYAQFSSMETWERASAEDPLFMLSMQWREEEFTLQRMLGMAAISGTADSDVHHLSQFTGSMVNDQIVGAWDAVKDELSGVDALGLDKWLLEEITKIAKE